MALLALGVLVLYLVLPLVIESLIAWRLQTALGTSTKPDVEVSSGFPPEMLFGRIDRVQVISDEMSLQDGTFYDARADLRGVNVSLPSLLEGSPIIETRSCSLRALRASGTVVQIDQNRTCLNHLRLGVGY